MLTLLRFGRMTSHSQVCFLEGPPFEVFLVPTTCHLASLALVTKRLCLVALQPFRLTGNTPWAQRSNWVSVLRRQVGSICRFSNHETLLFSIDNTVPLRLLVCFGFCFEAIRFAFLGDEAGFPRVDTGAGSVESRIVDGDGILIVSIPRQY